MEANYLIVLNNGLSTTNSNLGQAINNINSDISNLRKADLLLVKLPSIQVTTGANEFVKRQIISKADMDKQRPSGYTYITTLLTESGYGDQWQVTVTSYGGALYAQIESSYGAQLTANITGYSLYAQI